MNGTRILSFPSITYSDSANTSALSVYPHSRKNIHYIPPEVCLKILSNLDGKSVARCELVCKEWSAQIQSYSHRLPKKKFQRIFLDGRWKGDEDGEEEEEGLVIHRSLKGDKLALFIPLQDAPIYLRHVTGKEIIFRLLSNDRITRILNTLRSCFTELISLRFSTSNLLPSKELQIFLKTHSNLQEVSIYQSCDRSSKQLSSLLLLLTEACPRLKKLSIQEETIPWVHVDFTLVADFPCLSILRIKCLACLNSEIASTVVHDIMKPVFLISKNHDIRRTLRIQLVTGPFHLIQEEITDYLSDICSIQTKEEPLRTRDSVVEGSFIVQSKLNPNIAIQLEPLVHLHPYETL